MLSLVDTSTGYAPGIDEAGDGTVRNVNWYPTRPAREGNPFIVVPRPPIVTYSVSGLTGTIVGSYPFKDCLIVVTSDRRIWKVTEAAPTAATELSDLANVNSFLAGSLRPTFAEDGSSVFIAGGGQIQKWEYGATTATRLTAGPYNATHVAVLGQRVIANSTESDTTEDVFYWSDLGDALDTSWPVLNFANAEARPDDVRAIYENTSELFVWGETSLQIYGLTEDPTSPYGPANTVNVGIGAPYSPVRFDDDFIFIDEEGRIVRSDGRSIQDVGNGLEYEIRNMATFEDAWGWRERFGQWDAVVYRFPTARKTYRLDLKTNQWIELKKYSSGSGLNGDFPVGSYSHWIGAGLHLYGSSTAASFYQLTAASALDESSTPILCERETGWHDHGTSDWKRGGQILVTMKRGTGGASGTNDVLEVAVRDDGGAWSDWHQLNIGGDGQSEPVQQVWVGGVFRRRKYKFRYAGSSSTSLVSVFDDVDTIGGAG